MRVSERIRVGSIVDLRSDKILVKAAQTGRKDAASTLVKRYYPKVRSFISYLNGTPRGSEDLTQEVFAKALTALPRFNGSYRFEPWLLRIARNLCIDESRRKVHRPSPTDPIDLVELETTTNNEDKVWDLVSSGLAGRIVKQALQALPNKQRTVLVLREIEGMSYAEIAEVLEVTERSVEGTLRRARTKFRLEMVRAEADDEAKAACHRTLRLVASTADGMPPKDALPHLRRCAQCQAKVPAMYRSDRALRALAPLPFGAPSFLKDLVTSFEATRAGGIAKGIKANAAVSSHSMAVLEIAASVVMAAALSIASVGAPATSASLAAQSTSVKSTQTSTSVAVTQGEQVPQATEVSGTGSDTAASTPQEIRTPHDSSTAPVVSKELSLLLGLEDAVSDVSAELPAGLSQAIGEIESTLDELTEVTESVDIGNAPLKSSGVTVPELPGEDMVATSPATVTLPRRRYTLKP